MTVLVIDHNPDWTDTEREKTKKSFLCISYSDKFKNLKLQVLKGKYKVFHKIILLCRNSNILINSFICLNL